MQNGKKISELIQNLKSGDEQWESYILDAKKEIPKELRAYMNQLVDALREAFKEEKEEAVQYLKDELSGEEAAERLSETVEKTLRFYRSFSLIRKLEKQEPAVVKGLISAIYQKYIVRWERGWLKELAAERYQEEELSELARRMDYLTDYYVARAYTRQAMVMDLRYETGLSVENCEYWAELIDQNYLMLKMNYIVEELNKIKKNTAEK